MEASTLQTSDEVMKGSSFLADAKAAWHLLTSPGRGDTHQERLNQFYRQQASGYDRFRKRLLHGRQALIDQLSVPEKGVWVDLGCGTAENLERFADRLSGFSRIHLVDLCEPLLAVAKERCVALKSEVHIELHEADVTRFDLPDESVDLVTFSYSLTMIPDWYAAIENAYRMLRPGGMIGVVDFFVSRKFAAEGETQHRWSTRTLWPIWFAWDNVYLESDRLAVLQRRFKKQTLNQSLARVPLIPLVKVPYYQFIGCK